MAKVRTLPEITEEGTRALVRALGYSDAARFLTALRPGRGDYTKEKRAILKDVSLGEVLDASKKLNAARRAGRTARRKRSA